MSYSQHLKCTFEPFADGAGNLSHMALDFHSDTEPLDQKQIGSISFDFKKATTWTEAEELAAAMNRSLSGLCFRHLAAGEGQR